MVPAPPEDCRACGACCFGTPRHARVWGTDYDRLGDDAESVVLWIEDKAYLRVEGGRCEQLAREGDGVACKIYERRPRVCRDLERGSPACLAELEQKRERASAYRRCT